MAPRVVFAAGTGVTKSSRQGCRPASGRCVCSSGSGSPGRARTRPEEKLRKEGRRAFPAVVRTSCVRLNGSSFPPSASASAVLPFSCQLLLTASQPQHIRSRHSSCCLQYGIRDSRLRFFNSRFELELWPSVAITQHRTKCTQNH